MIRRSASTSQVGVGFVIGLVFLLDHEEKVADPKELFFLRETGGYG
jgi:hypothetical protein